MRRPLPKVRKTGRIAQLWDDLTPHQMDKEWKKCADDCAYFLSAYFGIKHPTKGQIPLPLNEAQRHTLRVWLNDRYSITLKARQIGFTTLAAGVILWQIAFHEDREIYIVSKTGRDAIKNKAMIDYAWRALPEAMRKRAGVAIRQTQEVLELDNGSRVESVNSESPARGYTGYMIFCDEAAHWKKFDDAWSAIEPAADVGGRIHILSTAKGIGNGFHRMWVESYTGVSDYQWIFYPWSAAEHRDQSWYDAQKRRMPEWQLHQEYPTTIEEAFIKSGRPVFDLDRLDGLDICAPLRVGFVDADGARPRIEDVDDGPLAIWEEPIPGDKYVLGVDVAEGLEHGDYSVIHVINTRNGRVAARWRGHVDPDTLGEIAIALAKLYWRALIGVEVNHHGYTTCQAIKRAGYGNQFKRVNKDERTNTQSRKLGWRTDVKTKRLMIDELRTELRSGGVILHDAATHSEMQSFVRDDNGKMHGSPFDDCVMSLAIANQMRQYFLTRDPEEIQDIRGTYAELELMLDRAEDDDMNYIIGGHSMRAA